MRIRTAAVLFGALIYVSTVAFAAFRPHPTRWIEAEPVPPGGRTNPFGLSGEALESSARQGRIHALVYPVETTPLLAPERSFATFVDSPADNPLRRLLQGLFHEISRFRTTDSIFEWLGLHTYPEEPGRGVYEVPFPERGRPPYRMGYGRIHTPDGMGFTLSCATCHSANLFGRKIIGMTNRFPKANEFFLSGRQAVGLVQPQYFQLTLGASDGETAMYEKLRDNSQWGDGVRPRVLGLDTSIAQVALSLSRREPDAYATRTQYYLHRPRADRLRYIPADSKPAVWWNAKYKNRWLSDGSVVAGNPIITNLLWNEIGRGANLIELEDWIDQNSQKIEQLTNAVFSSQAPLYTDFFEPRLLSVDRAKRGQALFNQYCARCHGTYQKAWDLPGSSQLAQADRIKTIRVLYHPDTPVIDVGTDPLRHQGMSSLEEPLNRLAISLKHGIRVRQQRGYVPPPLVGIWARWPYFHNNSAPSLCAVLTRAEDRPKTFYMGEALDPDRDFDRDCNGYPVGGATPHAWKKAELLYDTRRAGLSNSGHDEGIFLRDGRETLSTQDKRAIIEFLKTL